MDVNFWLKRWEKNEIGFHGNEVNPILIEHFEKLFLAKGSRVFLPLCGKTLDIAWLLSNGYKVAGAELSKIAIDQLFLELDEEPKILKIGAIEHYSSKNIDIFVGDIFHLSSKLLGSVDAIYDRAALVALPKEMRHRYTKHIIEIANNASQLLICYEYDQSQMQGPPFSIGEEEVKQHYGDQYHLNFITSENVIGGLKGNCVAKENVWNLQKIESKYSEI